MRRPFGDPSFPWQIFETVGSVCRSLTISQRMPPTEYAASIAKRVAAIDVFTKIRFRINPLCATVDVARRAISGFLNLDLYVVDLWERLIERDFRREHSWCSERPPRLLDDDRCAAMVPSGVSAWALAHTLTNGYRFFSQDASGSGISPSKFLRLARQQLRFRRRNTLFATATLTPRRSHWITPQ
jgi:hypothetical protein